MKKIESVAIIGMGALGLLFGQRIFRSLGKDGFAFVMDDERAEKHKKDQYVINGEAISFPIITVAELKDAPDLLIVATKYSGLRSAAKMAKEVVGENTTVISLLNGISSEEILSEYIPRETIIDCVAIGMDAMRDGTSLVYENMGRLQIGLSQEGQQDRLNALKDFFDKVEVPYEEPQDIKKAMWTKFMMNVGINQTCMVYQATYKEAMETSPAKDDLWSSMHEVIDIAKAEGVDIGEEEYLKGMEIFRTLSPNGYPSMSQDALAKRKSEVDLFAGAVMDIASKHGIPVPTNEKYFKIIQEMESKY